MKDPETKKFLHKFILAENGSCKICNFSNVEHSEYSVGNSDIHEEEIKLNVLENESNRQVIRPEIKKIQIALPQSVLDDFDDPNICRICFVNKLDENNKVSFSCQHVFCQECITNYLTSLIYDGKVLNIRCLYGGCPREFTKEEIKNFVTPEYWRKYRKFWTSKSAILGPDYKNCPHPDCDQVVQIDPMEVQIFNECDDNHKFCSKCLEEGWHQNGRCEKVHLFYY